MYTGAGGKGLTLAILAPTGSGLSVEQNYLTTLVQGELVAGVDKHSAIPVLDQVNLEKVLTETESGIYDDAAEYVELGKITGQDYIMTGTITKTSSGYALQIQVANAKESGATAASYSGTCTLEEFDNFSGIRRATADLLTQLGVQLTDAGKRELSGAEARQKVQAQTTLARGIVSGRSGNTVQTLSCYYEATGYAPSLKEAAARLSILSASVRTGSLKENLQNDIAKRNEWVNIIKETEAYLDAAENNDIIAQLFYDPTMIQDGLNYQNETIDIYCRAWMRATTKLPFVKVVKDVRNGLEFTVRNSDWKLPPPPHNQ
jgi:TolB-like protein